METVQMFSYQLDPPALVVHTNIAKYTFIITPSKMGSLLVTIGEMVKHISERGVSRRIDPDKPF
jgi:hypothetical protein